MIANVDRLVIGRSSRPYGWERIETSAPGGAKAIEGGSSRPYGWERIETVCPGPAFRLPGRSSRPYGWERIETPKPGIVGPTCSVAPGLTAGRGLKRIVPLALLRQKK